MSRDFKEEDKIKILLWCDRHCCLCDKACGTNIVVHHIEKDSADINDAIPLCLDCHGKIRSYDVKHALGTSYKIKEIKARREQIYEKYTRHLVPPVHFEITQSVRNDPRIRRKFPDVGFNLAHLGDSLPVKVKVEAKIILGGKDLGLVEDTKGYYCGKAEWNLNPRRLIFGHFSVPRKCVKSAEDFKIEVRTTIVDQYDREHQYLSECWTYVRKENHWFLEPRSFAKWT